jgi:hypothetical protein
MSNDIRVMILTDDGSHFAQGIEVDYCAQGNSVDDVKRRFAEGLLATLRSNVKKGVINNVLLPAPAEEHERFAETRLWPVGRLGWNPAKRGTRWAGLLDRLTFYIDTSQTTKKGNETP